MSRLTLLLTIMLCLCRHTQAMTTTLEPASDCVVIGTNDGSFDYDLITSSDDPLDALCDYDPDVFGDYRKKATYVIKSNVGSLFIDQLSFEVRRVPDMLIVFDEGEATEVIREIDIPDGQFNEWYEVDLEAMGLLPVHGISSIRLSIITRSVSNTRFQIQQICGVGCDEEMVTTPEASTALQPSSCPAGFIEADIADTGMFEHVVPGNDDAPLCNSGIEGRMRKRATYKIHVNPLLPFMLMTFTIEVKEVTRVFMELLDDSGNSIGLFEGIVPVSQINNWYLVNFNVYLPVSGVAKIQIKQIGGTDGMFYREICGSACIIDVTP